MTARTAYCLGILAAVVGWGVARAVGAVWAWWEEKKVIENG